MRLYDVEFFCDRGTQLRAHISADHPISDWPVVLTINDSDNSYGGSVVRFYCNLELLTQLIEELQKGREEVLRVMGEDAWVH